MNIDEAIKKELISLERQKEEWISVAGHIKQIICDFDSVNDDPIKILSKIDNFLDTAFGYMPEAIKQIKVGT